MKRILLVDDEKILQPAAELLRRHGYEVNATSNPSRAIDNYDEHYDLVLTEMNLPAMTGFQLYREVKKRDKDAKVAFFTTFEVRQSEFGKMFPGLDPVQLILKPITIAALVRRIEAIIGVQSSDQPAPSDAFDSSESSTIEIDDDDEEEHTRLPPRRGATNH